MVAARRDLRGHRQRSPNSAALTLGVSGVLSQYVAHILPLDGYEALTLYFARSPQSAGSGAEAPSPAYVLDFLACSDGLKLIEAFTQIGTLRRSLVRLVEELAGESDS
jgi:hypothetical protein